MSITSTFIQSEIQTEVYEISLHADDERIADGLTVSQLEFALLDCEILEQYPDDPRGESCLALGFVPEGTAVHIICGKTSLGHLFVASQ